MAGGDSADAAGIMVAEVAAATAVDVKTGSGVVREEAEGLLTLKFANAGTSSASATTTQMGVPILHSFPGGMMILARIPSSCASKSTLALSVSMLHKTSPAAKLSPSAMAHDPMVPLSIVGESAGIGNNVCSGY